MIKYKNYNKYKNIKVNKDNITFSSKKEQKRYDELLLLQRLGKIDNLECQKKFKLLDTFKYNNETQRSINYICDFYYYDKDLNKYIIEDVKGSKNTLTDVYKIKKKLFINKYIINNDNLIFIERY